jgi:hypothetical protein
MFSPTLTAGMVIILSNKAGLSNHSFQGLKKSSNNEGVIIDRVNVVPITFNFYCLKNYDLKVIVAESKNKNGGHGM